MVQVERMTLITGCGKSEHKTWLELNKDTIKPKKYSYNRTNLNALKTEYKDHEKLNIEKKFNHHLKNDQKQDPKTHFGEHNQRKPKTKTQLPSVMTMSCTSVRCCQS
ncbi:hypothetical protein ATANTOWER_021578 [Ataeniobius toweri]|uniref:Uncharacterized protein n=1 Tax=Ataeniobius toweri TaxID=208326 RepID=A0ABU7BHH9_9TELE|nr:hypothetical protein [Ataeniobius toweri]